MVQFKTMLFVAIIMFMVTSCRNDKGDIPTTSSKSVDTIQNDYARAFRIIYGQKSAQIDILNPDTKEVIKKYYIGGSKTEEINVFPSEIERVVPMSTTMIGMLRKLKLDKNIIGVPNFDYLCHPLNESKVTEVGDIHETQAEKFVDLHPDIIFYPGFNLEEPILNKLEQAHLKPFLIYEWKEQHPLGRAEWIKVFGVVFGKQKEAHAAYQEIKAQYKDIKYKLGRATEQPSVLLGTYFNDEFSVSAGGSYMAHLLKDANVKYKYAATDGTGSINYSLEKIITENATTDYWLDAAATSLSNLTKQSERFKLMAAVRNKKVFSYFNQNNCFWESSPIQPHKILEDFGKIFHPELFDDVEMTFYDQLQ